MVSKSIDIGIEKYRKYRYWYRKVSIMVARSIENIDIGIENIDIVSKSTDVGIEHIDFSIEKYRYKS